MKRSLLIFTVLICFGAATAIAQEEKEEHPPAEPVESAEAADVARQEPEADTDEVEAEAETIEEEAEEKISEEDFEDVSDGYFGQEGEHSARSAEAISEESSEAVEEQETATESAATEETGRESAEETEGKISDEDFEDVADGYFDQPADSPQEAASEESATDETAPAKPDADDEGDASDLPTPELAPAKHEELARQANEAGDFGSAAYHWQRAIAGEPSNLRWGTDYRQAVIAADAKGTKKAYEECIDFFEALAEKHPDIAAVRLNLGYAYVDKIPVEGAITAVILANKALKEFTAALEVEESWLGYYTRGNSYMYWPAIFGRTELGIADLEKALALADELPERPYHGRAWAALGDGYWRLEDREKMRQVWQEGLERYPGTEELEQRLAREGEELDAWLEKHFETSTRVGTHLRELAEAGDLP